MQSRKSRHKLRVQTSDKRPLSLKPKAMKTVKFTTEEIEQLEAYLYWTKTVSTKTKNDIRNIDNLLNKLK